MKKLIVGLCGLVCANAAFAAGFGLYEASARGNALGGTLVGSTKDASAVYYNPANMTETTNVSVMVGTTFTWLYADTKVGGRCQPEMNPGVFYIPHFYFTTPVWDDDLFFGLGLYCEDGLGTEYGAYWDLAGDTVKTTLAEFTLNPNLAYKITDWWSVGAGLKLSYIYFYNMKHPYWRTQGYKLKSELEGDSFAMGYNFGTTFRLFEDEDLGRLALGVVYRSQIKHNIKGDFDIDGKVGPYSYSKLGGDRHSDASARLTLPQSVTAGLNWDSPNRKWHAGAAVTWTQWSCVDMISFKIPAKKAVTRKASSYDLPLNWQDAWRGAIGLEYDVTDDFSLRASYVYDMDPTNDDYGTTMLPGGHRSIIGLGFGYNIWSTLRLDVGYSWVYMEDGTRGIEGGDGKEYVFATDGGRSHMLSVSLSYTF